MLKRYLRAFRLKAPDGRPRPRGTQSVEPLKCGEPKAIRKESQRMKTIKHVSKQNDFVMNTRLKQVISALMTDLVALTFLSKEKAIQIWFEWM